MPTITTEHLAALRNAEQYAEACRDSINLCRGLAVPALLVNRATDRQVKRRRHGVRLNRQLGMLTTKGRYAVRHTDNERTICKP